ncbi:hypothetical protein [Spirillospora albida]|uniref:hypothetical protein n=1 Tax=Spirillospora albida TaxID=58123 RepID=UPI0004C06249|nr:hypothetical protein [Spirillospora albida]
MTDPIVVVPHTHGDRECYLPFQRFRLRLAVGPWQILHVAQGPEPSEAVVAGAITAAERVDLRGRAMEPLPVDDGTVRLALGPWEIATPRLGTG